MIPLRFFLFGFLAFAIQSRAYAIQGAGVIVYSNSGLGDDFAAAVVFKRYEPFGISSTVTDLQGRKFQAPSKNIKVIEFFPDPATGRQGFLEIAEKLERLAPEYRLATLALQDIAKTLRTEAASLPAKIPLPSESSTRTITDTKGRTYTNAVVKSVDPDGVRIAHSNGVKNLSYEELTPELRNEFGLKPVAPGVTAPFTATTLNPPQRPLTTTSNPASADEESPQEVISGGVGKDETSALKDAFRNAVEQVVGLVVDSTVRTENDEIIKDQILTASDGFVKVYTLLSSDVEDGLTRVRIKAKIERKSLVEKLEAKQVVVTKVNMNNLFAKVVSDNQSVEDATLLVAERIKEFHKVWAAEAGEPAYDRNTGTLRIPLTISADTSAYSASTARLAEVLDKISIRKSHKLLTSIESNEKDGEPIPSTKLAYFTSGLENSSNIQSFQQQVDIKGQNYKATEWLKAEEFDQLPKDAFWIWLCISEKNFTTEWVGYAIDADIDKIGPLLFPEWSISVILRDENEIVIGSYELNKLDFESRFWVVDTCDPWSDGDAHSQMGMHPHLVSMGDSRYNRSGMGRRLKLRENKTSSKDSPFVFPEEDLRFQCLIAPHFMTVGSSFDLDFYYPSFAYWKQEVVEATFPISIDEIKDIHKTEIAITANPRTIKDK